MPITMYGIRNCETVRKARAWLDARGVSYEFKPERYQQTVRPGLRK